jgi:hypothetical protein
MAVLGSSPEPESKRGAAEGSSEVIMRQPVLLRLARQRLDDEFDHASVAAVRDTITSTNLLACFGTSAPWFAFCPGESVAA